MFEWAEKYPEVHRICKLFDLTELENPVKFKYKSLPCLLQEGPQCGLVALAVCAKNCSKEIIREMMKTAKSKCFTNNGEMFSASQLCDIAQEYLIDNNIELYRGCLHQDRIIDHLLNGGLMLVPYDTDRDFRPCLQNGHKAHWAVTSGAIQTETDFFVIARHGKARNVAIWKLKDLAESNQQLNEFAPDRKYSNLTYVLPEGGINGSNGICSFAILIHPNL